jgi:hypothetical protein
VPTPLNVTLELEISLSPGRHPVWPALYSCRLVVIAGRLTGAFPDTQPSIDTRIPKIVAMARIGAVSIIVEAHSR